MQRWWLPLALVFLPAMSTRGQSSEFLPEVDNYFNLSSDARFFFQAKQTREGGDPEQGQVGPSIQFYFKPLVRLRDNASFDLDQSKKRVFAVAVGYRYLPSPSAPPTNRLRLDTTSNLPLKAGLMISDRNRFDLDWQNRQLTWRYRNKLVIERTVRIVSYHPRPYVAVEPFYESRYGKWSTTALYAGCLFPVGKHVQFDSYYEHQNNTGKSPNQQLNQFGLILGLYF